MHLSVLTEDGKIIMPRDGAHMPGWLRDRLEDREPVYPRADPSEGLNPMEQMELLSNEFCILVADQAPNLCEKVFGYYQVVGEHVEFPAAMVQRADRSMSTWRPPPGAEALLDRLRAGTLPRARLARLDQAPPGRRRGPCPGPCLGP